MSALRQMQDQSRRVRGEARYAWRAVLIQSRAVVGFVLLVAALVWAIARGLHFYGASPVHLVYDVDQPPWLLLLVSGWLVYRSRRR